jgi:rRNA maturation protein Nop10
MINVFVEGAPRSERPYCPEYTLEVICPKKGENIKKQNQ